MSDNKKTPISGLFGDFFDNDDFEPTNEPVNVSDNLPLDETSFHQEFSRLRFDTLGGFRKESAPKDFISGDISYRYDASKDLLTISFGTVKATTSISIGQYLVAHYQSQPAQLIGLVASNIATRVAQQFNFEAQQFAQQFISGVLSYIYDAAADMLFLMFDKPQQAVNIELENGFTARCDSRNGRLVALNCSGIKAKCPLDQ